jgi:hypothetical protein
MQGESAVGDLSKLSQEMTRDTDRWIEELRLHGIRPTLGHGMMIQCSRYAERLMRHCAIVLLYAGGDEGRALLATVRKGVPIEKLTMGELIRLLKRLVPALKGKALPDDFADEKAWPIFDRVLEMRNAFVHPKEDVHEDAALWLAYLEAAKELSSTRLVRAAIDIQQHGMIE